MVHFTQMLPADTTDSRRLLLIYRARHLTKAGVRILATPDVSSLLILPTANQAKRCKMASALVPGVTFIAISLALKLRRQQFFPAGHRDGPDIVVPLPKGRDNSPFHYRPAHCR